MACIIRSGMFTNKYKYIFLLSVQNFQRDCLQIEIFLSSLSSNSVLLVGARAKSRQLHRVGWGLGNPEAINIPAIVFKGFLHLLLELWSHKREKVGLKLIYYVLSPFSFCRLGNLVSCLIGKHFLFHLIPQLGGWLFYLSATILFCASFSERSPQKREKYQKGAIILFVFGSFMDVSQKYITKIRKVLLNNGSQLMEIYLT